MTKLRNKILLVFLALCLVACMGIFVACGGDDDKKPDAKPVTYTVTVKMDNTAVKGVKVTVKKGSVSFAPKITGDDGKVQFSLTESNDYTVELSDLPENYEVPGGATLSFPSDRNLTVNLAEKFAYKVKLVNPDGSAFAMEGVTVGICDTNNQCRTPVAIDENGLARIESTKEDYHIQILGLPVGYAYECDSKGYSVHQSEEGTYIYEGDDNTYNSLSATVYEQTVTIYPVNVIDFSKLTPLTDDEIAEYNDQTRTITGAKAYKIQATVPAESTVYYTFVPEYAGTYNLYAIGYDGDTMGYKINPRFLLGDTVASGSGIFYGSQAIQANADSQYYINITAKSAQLELEFILTTPAASKDTVTGATTVNAVVGEGVNAVIELAPTAGASYKLTVQGNGAIAQAYDDESAASYEFADADYQANSYCEVKITNSMIGVSKYFAVSVKADKYPADVVVKVEKIADLPDTVDTVTPSVTLTQFGEQTGKELVEIEMDGTSSAKIIYNEADKFYHYGTADGPIVVVMLKKALPADRLDYEASILYLELATNMRVAPYKFDVTTAEDEADLTKGNTYKDYRMLLRGFTDYKATPVTGGNGYEYTIPADITVQSYYAKYVNSDGVYPLTKDLKDYLELMIQEDSILYHLPWDAADNDLWLFACYYYDTFIEPDVIVGEYNHVAIKATEDGILTEENGDLTGDEYTLVINKRGTYVIKEINFFGAEVYEKGTWTKDGENYTFTTSEGTVYTNVMFDAEEGYVTLMTADSTGWAFRNENSEVVDVIVGDYEFVSRITADEEETKVGDSYRNMLTGEMVTVTKDSYKLTVNNDGTFNVYEQSGSSYVEVYSEAGAWNYKKGAYTFTVPNADIDEDFNPIDLVFTVDYNIGTGELTLNGADTSKWEFKKDGEAFVGLYELVSFTEDDNVYSVGEEYGDGEDAIEVTKDTYTFTVVGNTFELNDNMNYINEFKGTWTKTYGGKYIIAYEDWFGTMEATARYNKVNNQVTVVFGDADSGYTTYVFQKKASQAIDAIVGEYYIEKMVDFGDEKTVENGDLRSDDYKLEVRASGRFSILKYGYPDYVVSEDDGFIGLWTKTEDGYEFSYIGGWWVKEVLPYETTVSEDLTEISLDSDTLGWSFTKSAPEVGEADVIVGEYKFVMQVTGEGDVIQVGDTIRMEEITEDTYTLVVLNGGRFAIIADVAEVLGIWTNEDGVYTFIAPDLQDAVTYVQGVTFVVELGADNGRISLTSENNGSWVFQKGGIAEQPYGTLYTEDGNTMMEIYEWGFKLSLKDGEEWTLLVSGEVVGGDEEHPEVEILESTGTVSGVALEMVVEGEDEENMAVLMKVTVSYTDDTDQEYCFDMTEML